jgi:hypothetical protein
LPSLPLLLLQRLPYSAARRTPIEPPKQVAILQQSDFPLAVGYWWKYLVTDGLGNPDDTITVSIVNSQVVGVQTQFNFEVRKNNGAIVDSGFYATENGTVKYKSKHPGYPYFGDIYYSFPMQDSSTWPATSATDAVYVVGIADSIVFYNKVYKPMFFLQRNHKTGPTYQYLQTQELCPKVGLVSASIYYYDMYPRQSQAYFLIDYKVN